MAILDVEAIRQSFRDALVSEIGLTAGVLAPENRDYTPPAAKGTIWYFEHLEIMQNLKAATDTRLTEGVYHLDILIGSGKGTDAVDAQASLMENAFQPGKVALASQGVAISIFRAARGSGRIVERFKGLYYGVPLSLYWRTFTLTTD